MTRIVSTGVATRSEWEAAYVVTPTRTYFQSPDWAELWADYSPRLRPAAIRATFDDGVVVIVPGNAQQRRTFRQPRLVAAAAGTYGGLLSQAQLRSEHVAAVVSLLQQRPGLSWFGNPLDDHPVAGEIPAGATVTHLLPVADGMDPVRSGLSKGHRSAINKARREGVVVRPGATLADWRSYFEIYEQSLARWGDRATSAYTWRLFELLHRRSPDVVLWLASAGEAVIAGAVIVYAGEHAGYWHGAAVADAFGKRPVHLLLWNVMEDAIERGVRWFDFLPSGGHEGVTAFKASFGAQATAVPRLAVPPAREGLGSRFSAVARWYTHRPSERLAWRDS